MKRLHATGKYLEKRQAQPVTPEQEDRTWEMGLLGDRSAPTLLNTIVWQASLLSALRSGAEHRRLRHHPSQIQFFEPPGGRAYLVYKEGVKNKPGRAWKPP